MAEKWRRLLKNARNMIDLGTKRIYNDVLKTMFIVDCNCLSDQYVLEKIECVGISKRFCQY